MCSSALNHLILKLYQKVPLNPQKQFAGVPAHLLSINCAKNIIQLHCVVDAVVFFLSILVYTKEACWEAIVSFENEYTNMSLEDVTGKHVTKNSWKLASGAIKSCGFKEVLNCSYLYFTLFIILLFWKFYSMTQSISSLTFLCWIWSHHEPEHSELECAPVYTEIKLSPCAWLQRCSSQYTTAIPYPLSVAVLIA